jgi:ketosteroid isomerase-like protein
MSTNEQEIRTVIERWVDAVHTGDLATVVEDHSADIVMFDVPPPYAGVRGLDEYRETWPGFFQWQASGAVFEIESLDVTAGEEVAFAFALLKCGMAEDFPSQPSRLRLTLGLRKDNGRWTVSHEHHSFPSEESPAAETEVRELHAHWSERTAAKDLEGLMDGIAEDIVSYEHAGPLEYVGKSAVREVCKAGLDGATENVQLSTPDLTVLARGDLAVAWGLDHVEASTNTGKVDSWSRATRIFRRQDNGWKMVHQHLSYPLDTEHSDTARITSKRTDLTS